MGRNNFLSAVIWRFLARVYGGDHQLVVDLVVGVVGVVLWFGALLALLSILELEAVAASLGTSTSFIALSASPTPSRT